MPYLSCLKSMSKIVECCFVSKSIDLDASLRINENFERTCYTELSKGWNKVFGKFWIWNLVETMCGINS